MKTDAEYVPRIYNLNHLILSCTTPKLEIDFKIAPTLMSKM